MIKAAEWKTYILGEFFSLLIIQNRWFSSVFEHLLKENSHFMGPYGFGGSGENGYLFSGSWGALVVILGELGSKFIVWGIYRALPKRKKKEKSLTLMEKNSILFAFLN